MRFLLRITFVSPQLKYQHPVAHSSQLMFALSTDVVEEDEHCLTDKWMYNHDSALATYVGACFRHVLGWLHAECFCALAASYIEGCYPEVQISTRHKEHSETTCTVVSYSTRNVPGTCLSTGLYSVRYPYSTATVNATR